MCLIDHPLTICDDKMPYGHFTPYKRKLAAELHCVGTSESQKALVLRRTGYFTKGGQA